MARGLLGALQLFALLAVSATAGPTFLIISPLTIRPGLNITVGVDLLSESQPQVKVRAEILKKNTTVVSGEGLFQKGSFETLVLPALPLNSVDGTYELLVNGYAGNKTVFFKSTPLEFESKGFSVFIQTDKSLYKPGQEVKMRVVAVNLDLKPYDAVIDLHIRDPRGNLICQWLAEQGDLGVLSKNFQISANPPLGDWSIEAQVNKQIHYQTFTVMEYVLPKFEVAVKMSSHHSLTEKELTGVITAKYTYGKPVKGNVTITLVPSSIWVAKKNITKTLKINGSVNFSFDHLELEQLVTNKHHFDYDTPSLHGPVEVVAVVTEFLTGISHNGSTSVLFNEKNYTIEFSDYPEVLKPSLNFTASLKVMRYGNKPLTAEERRNVVTVSVTQSRRNAWNNFDSSDNGNMEQKSATVQVINYTIPESNIIQMDIPVLTDTYHLIIQAHFLDAINRISVSDVFNSPNMTYIQIKKSSQDIKVGISFELNIQSNQPIKELSYLVLSRRRIVTVGKKTSTTFTLTPESSWTPVACVIVYYISDNGDIINDLINLPIQHVFDNKVSLSWSKEKSMPSEKVLLTLSAAESNSLIGLSVIDKSVTLMDNSHEFTSNHVVQELDSYNKNEHRQVSSSAEVFEKCNVRILTDANLTENYNFPDLIYYDSVDYELTSLFLEEEKETLDFHNPRIRTFFPETWLWIDTRTGSKASTTLEVKVPDTITTWVANAFVISANLGLGLTTTPVQLEAFQAFFLSLNLPYSVTRGEQFILEVTIFNYLDETSEVIVTLDTNDAFDILVASNDVNATENQQFVSVPSQDGLTVLFPIKPKQLGEIPITVKATSEAASDAITQRILVKAEGIVQSHSQSVLLDLAGKQTASGMLTFTFPSNVVSGSENAYVTVVGDIVGPSISGLESLIQMPFGCGEQNMIRFAPNIYVLDYLTNAHQITEEISKKAISFMIEGYQRELTYQRDDGSFSAFGNDDPSGSTWLSSFVLRCFLQAHSFIYIDPVILQKTATWLTRHQNPSGEFWEPGRVLNTQLQGGNNSPITLTAYIMTALVEYPGYKNSFHVQAAVNFLESKLNEGISDNYTLALVTYALSLAGSIQAKESLDILNQRAEKQGDLRFWRSSAHEMSDWRQPNSADIELAGYVLLSHVKQNRIAEGIPIMKWLSQNRNHLGGYSSTQDTIVALQALSSFAGLITVSKTEISVSVTGPDLNNLIRFKIDSQNRFVMQMQQIAVTQPMEVNVSAFGYGFAVFQMNILYNLKDVVTARKRRYVQNQETFDLDVAVKDDKKDINHVTLNVCTRYLGTETSTVSGMALMEVDLLSGFTLSPNVMSTNNAVKKVEHGNGKVVLYFDSLNKTKICVDIPAERDSKVGYTQDASVLVMDYYEPKRKAVRSYNSEVMRTLSPCVFCEKDCSICKTGSGAIGLLQHSLQCFPLLILFIFHLILV